MNCQKCGIDQTKIKIGSKKCFIKIGKGFEECKKPNVEGIGFVAYTDHPELTVGQIRIESYSLLGKRTEQLNQRDITVTYKDH